MYSRACQHALQQKLPHAYLHYPSQFRLLPIPYISSLFPSNIAKLEHNRVISGPQNSPRQPLLSYYHTQTAHRMSTFYHVLSVCSACNHISIRACPEEHVHLFVCCKTPGKGEKVYWWRRNKTKRKREGERKWSAACYGLDNSLLH